ncbi:MAG TPA: C-terminal helicase domain-containing protein, partial [Actinotalea sp.]|nr:C-terminal helicase domain-containing protein [Actinotalea sp.]
AGAIHGDLGQGAREQALRAFRHGKIDVLVATDVAARGIDVEDVTHVVNYQCPEDEKVYLHRTGRTGRAGRTGTAVTFVDWDDLPRWGLIDKALDLGYPEPQETYSSSPHLYTDLDIPEGTTGRLPKAAQVRQGLAAEEVEDLGETGKHAGRADQGRSGGRGERSGGGRGERSGGGRSERSGGGRGGERSGGGRGGERTGERSTPGRNGRSGQAGQADVPGSAEASQVDGEAARAPRKRRRRRRSGAGGPDAAGSAGAERVAEAQPSAG